jgi:hypothetical protein
MGRTKQFPCPSAVFLAVVATKPCYTIVSVFVKDCCLLLDMSRLGMCVLVLLGGIFSLPEEATGSTALAERAREQCSGNAGGIRAS